MQPLDAVDTPPGARDRGTVIHGAIGDYTAEFAKGAPADPLKELTRLGEKRFKPLADYPEARAFWWPRFERIARWFAQWDHERREGLAALFAEIKGELSFPAGERTFTLSAVADRIERRTRRQLRHPRLQDRPGAHRETGAHGAGAAIDAGSRHPARRQVRQICAPGSVSEISYVTLKGGEPAGLPCPINFKDGTPDSQADNALGKLKALAPPSRTRASPIYSLVHPMWKTHYGDYDHLARVKEWSLTGGGDEEGGE